MVGGGGEDYVWIFSIYMCLKGAILRKSEDNGNFTSRMSRSFRGRSIIATSAPMSDHACLLRGRFGKAILRPERASGPVSMS